MRYRHGILALSLLGMLSLAGCSLFPNQNQPAVLSQAQDQPQSEGTVTSSASVVSTDQASRTSSFGQSVKYQEPSVKIDPAVAKDFDIQSIQNLKDMEQAYGVKFTTDEMAYLAKNKFLVKNLLDTSIRPNSNGDTTREFIQLYEQVRGNKAYKERKLENSIFFSSDVFLDAYNNLYVELLKEMENKDFYPAMKSLSENLYKQAGQELAQATTEQDKNKWTKVRNYFAVPYAIFSNAAQPLTADDYYRSGEQQDPEKVQAEYTAKDAKIDAYDSVAQTIKGLKLDKASEDAVLSDLKQIYDPQQAEAPAIFAQEYEAYATQTGVAFKVDFTQFTPRGTYTSSSLRRQYFRGMKWYIMLPFFLKSQDLTTYAFGLTQLLSENPQALKDYDRLEAAIGFMVGSSDDLMPADYLQALQVAKGQPDQEASVMDHLTKAHNPKIKDMAAAYPNIGQQQSSETLLATKGLRFFSGKYIMDSYWTGYLTQGDEAVRPGYTQKLPPMASSLEVMTLLGSDYARTQIPKLDFYSADNEKAINQALDELKAENSQLADADWEKNLYTGWLWVIKSLFDWTKTNQASLPRFMQSQAWDVKNLMTASGFWTELRHATILYAKQSFAELGGGGEACDTRKVPPPPKGYIEPDIEAYARLIYLAQRTDQGLKDQGFRLNNFQPLENFIGLMQKIQGYVQKELENVQLSEKVMTQSRPDPQDPDKTCKQEVIDGISDWEALRVAIISGLEDSLPAPVEGPVLTAKDKRLAIVADVHTGGDSNYPTSILYQGTGVPYVIFTAVSDANGPRLTVGFTFSHYEFTEVLGGKRLTDEDWQKGFYKGSDTYNAYDYTEKSAWPKENTWYAPLFGE